MTTVWSADYSDEIRRVLESLKNAGLCVCEKRFIENHHLALMDDDDRIITRIEETSP